MARRRPRRVPRPRRRPAGDPAGRASSIAVETATDRVVGYASLARSCPARRTVAYHDMTAVLRDWRGRGLAGALKRATIAWAIDHGVDGARDRQRRGQRPDAGRERAARLPAAAGRADDARHGRRGEDPGMTTPEPTAPGGRPSTGRPAARTGAVRDPAARSRGLRLRAERRRPRARPRRAVHRRRPRPGPGRGPTRGAVLRPAPPDHGRS